jgi:hypothetical protein
MGGTMNDTYVIVVEGLKKLADFNDLDEKILTAARRAVNRATERTKTAAARQMRKEVNFPARWLSGSNGKLSITKRASGRDLEGIIKGRDRPTSLARFATSGSAGKEGVSVNVAPGRSKFLKRAFLMKLRAGSSLTETSFNMGLAVRTKSPMRKSRGAKQIGKNLYLLYGPSVDQVFRGVAADQAPAALDFLDVEFMRQLDL